MGEYSVVLYLDHANERYTVTGRRSPLRVVDRQMEEVFPNGVREVILEGVTEDEARAKVDELRAEWDRKYRYFIRGTPTY